MKLSNSQERNINCIILYCLDERNKKYDIINSSKTDNQVQVSFIRKISINELEDVNSYLCSNIRNKRLIYKFIITPSTVEIMLDQPEFKQVSLFDDVYNKDNLKDYNDMLNSRLMNVKDLLINTFFNNDDNVQDWIYFFIAPKYIGYANGDIKCPSCIKGDSKSIPEGVYKLRGTYNDAKCVLLRRNQNSTRFGNWRTVPDDIYYIKEFIANL